MSGRTISGDKLNRAQRQAVAIDHGPALILAGAGTGKTRVIVERITRLLGSGTLPSRILALTFTEKAAAEMLDRVNDQSGSYHLDLPIMTFNAFGVSMLRRYAADIGLGRNFGHMGDSAVIVFMQERLDAIGLDYFAPISRPHTLLGDIRDYFSRLKQQVITPEIYASFVKKMPATDDAEKLQKKKHQELERAYATYIRLSREANVIDYDDQIYLLIELLLKRPNVLSELQAAYDFVMIDEFQDTNKMQSILTDLLVGEKQNLFVVGDDDQSIYGWRGATLANILEFKERYPRVQEVTLTQNYRSTSQILDAAYRIIQHNNPFRLETRLGINKQLVSKRRGPKPVVRSFDSQEEELAWIASDIKQRLTAGVAPAAIAILARRNTTVQLLDSYLSFEKIEHVVSGQRYELYSEPIVRMMLEALRTVVDPTDSTSLYHTLTGPLFSLPATELAVLAAAARGQHESLYNALKASQHTAARLALQMIATWRDHSTSLSVGQLSLEMLDNSGYKEQLYKKALADATSDQAITRLSELFKTMKEFEQIALVPSALQYVMALPALQAAGDSNEDAGLELSRSAVTVTTIHKAKGLEWPIVYIADCSEGSFPLRENPRGIALPEGLVNSQQSEADSHLAEERRLMYVAMTRAGNELVLTHAARHRGNSVRKPSRFLSEAFDPKTFQLSTVLASAPRQLDQFEPLPPQAVTLPLKMFDGTTLTLTVSQAQKYLDCPLDFYYRYVLQVPQPSSVALEYGSLLHSLLETLNRSLLAGKLTPYGVLETQLQRDWPRSGFLSSGHRDRAWAQATKTLRNLYERVEHSPRVPLLVEEAFCVNLPEQHLKLKGRFDAVFPVPKGVEIVDYKTSASVDTPEKAKRRASASQQLTLYALAWQVQHDELPALVTLDFVDTDMRGSLRKTPAGIDAMRGRLKKLTSGLRAREFNPGTDHLFCIHPPL